MSAMILFLLSRTLILTAAAFFVGAMLTVLRCRDPKTARFGWELVLLLGLIGAAVPLLPTGVTLEGYFTREIENGKWKMENGGDSAASPAEMPADSRTPTAPLTMGRVGEADRGSGRSAFDSLGPADRSFADPDAAWPNNLSPRPSESSPSGRGAEENGGAEGATFLKSQNFLPALLAVWFIGAVVFLTLGAVSYRRVCRELAQAEEPEGERLAEWQAILRESGLDSRKGIHFLLTETVGPSLIWRPFCGKTVAVPRDLWLLADSRVRTGILRHELAHLRHRDLIRLTLAQGIALLHWFNPAARWALRRLEESIERLCDAEAFGHDRDGAIRFVESMLTLYRTTPSITVFQNPFGRSDFLRRVEGLKNLQLNLGETPMKRIIIAVMALAVTLGGIVASFGGMENGKLKVESGGESDTMLLETPADSPTPTAPSCKGAEDKAVPLTVRVLNHRTNQPLAGATIDWGWSAESLSPLEASKLTRQTVTTDETGVGVLNLPSEREFSQLGGTLDVTVSAPGFMAEGKTTDLWWPRQHARRREYAEDYHFALEEAQFVTGTLARTDGVPLENLSIQSAARYSQAIRKGILSKTPEKTDASDVPTPIYYLWNKQEEAEKTDVSDSRRPEARNRAEIAPSADGKSVAFKIPVFRDGVARFTFTADNAAPKEIAMRIPIPLEFFRGAARKIPDSRRQSGDGVEKAQGRQYNIPDDLGRVELAPGIRPTLVLRDAEGKPLSGVAVTLRSESDEVNPIPRFASFIERVATTNDEGKAVFLPIEPARYSVQINLGASGILLRSQPIPNAGAFDNVYSWDISADNLADAPVKEIQAAKTVSLTLAFNTLIPIPDRENFPALVLDGLRTDENGLHVEAFHLGMESVRTETTAADDGALVSRWTLTGIPNDLAGVRLNGGVLLLDHIDAENPVTVRLPNGETFRDPQTGNMQRTPEMLPCPNDGDVWEVTVERPAKAIVRAVDPDGQPVARFAASVVYFPNPGHGALESLLTVNRNDLAGRLLLTPEGLARFRQAAESEENRALLDTPFSAKNLRDGAFEIERLLPKRKMWIYAASGNAQGSVEVTLAPGETSEITIPLAAVDTFMAAPTWREGAEKMENGKWKVENGGESAAMPTALDGRGTEKDDQTESIPLAGRILDGATGEPLAGGTAALSYTHTCRELFSGMSEGRSMNFPIPTDSFDGDTVTVAADGRFSFSLNPNAPEKYLCLSVKKEGYVVRTVGMELSEFLTAWRQNEPLPNFTTVALYPAATWTGRLTDENAQPLAETPIDVITALGKIENAEAFAGPRYRKERIFANADGRFAVTGFSEGITQLICQPEVLPAQDWVIDQPPGDFGDWKLAPGIHPTVTVLDKNGAPVLNVRVFLNHRLPAHPNAAITTPSSRRAFTDANGKATFNVMPGTYDCSVTQKLDGMNSDGGDFMEHRAKIGLFYPIHQELTEKQSDLVLRAVPPVTVTLQVESEDAVIKGPPNAILLWGYRTKEPSDPNALREGFFLSTEKEKGLFADEGNGVFRLLVPDDLTDVTVSLAPFFPGFYANGWKVTLSVKETGQTFDCDLGCRISLEKIDADTTLIVRGKKKATAPGTHSVIGRLRGEGGAILAETPLSFVSWRPVEGKPIAFDDPESVTKGQTQTDAEGRFTIHPFTDGQCVVTAEPTDFAMTTFSVESGASDLGDLTVERGVRPEFTLRERDGSPVKQGAVMLMPLDKTPGGWYSFLCRRIGFADEQGKVVCPPVKPGEYVAGILPPKPMGEMRETWIITITPENKPRIWTAPETISITLRGLPPGDYFSTNGVWKILSSMRSDEEGRLREFSIRNFEAVDLGDGTRRLDGIPVGSETLALAFGQMFDDYTIRLRVEGENAWREVKGNGEVFLPSFSQNSTVELECKPIDKAAVAAEKERNIEENRALAEKIKNDPNVTITKIGKTVGDFESALAKSTRPEEAAVRLYQAYLQGRDVNEICDRIARLETVQGETIPAEERQTLAMLWKGGGFDTLRERINNNVIDTVCQRRENALVICRTDEGIWQCFPVLREEKSGEWLLSGPTKGAPSLEDALAEFAKIAE